MYEKVDYAKTKEEWTKTCKMLSRVAPSYGVNAASARKFLTGHYYTNTPDEGEHAKMCRMFEKEGCLVFKRSRKKAA